MTSGTTTRDTRGLRRDAPGLDGGSATLPMTATPATRGGRVLALGGVGVLLAVTVLVGQAVITAPKNNYSPAEDVSLGRKAAAEVEQQLPLLRDDTVQSMVSAVGRRLAGSIPADLQHAEFRYGFQVVNVREINAFALPGGPMYVNRGMIEAARSEGEVAGVMAHELSHVALRHGTAQATKATKYEIGSLLGTVLGSVIGGNVGSAVAQGTQFGLGTAFLRFSREFERQADLLGSHIMADAGYDPREMASMFKTIQEQGGSSGPAWLSSHPDPGDRYTAITREASLLSVRNPVRDSGQFVRAQAQLHRMAPAPTTEEATTTSTTSAPAPAPTATNRAATSRTDTSGVAGPATSVTTYSEGGLFRVSVPSNWRKTSGSNAVIFAPDGALDLAGGRNGFTRGMQIGVTQEGSRNLRTATDSLIASMARGNDDLGRPTRSVPATVGGRRGLRTTLSNGSGARWSQARVAVYTVLLPDSSLFHAIGVSPGDRAADYDEAFTRIVNSIEFTDAQAKVRPAKSRSQKGHGK